MKRRWYVAGLVVLVAATVMVVNAQLSRDYASEFLNNPTGRALVQAFGALKSGYLNDVDDDALIQGAITGMLESLDDPYTSYLLPKDAARDSQDLTGSFEGIGAVLTPTTGRAARASRSSRSTPAARPRGQGSCAATCSWRSRGWMCAS